MHLAKKQFNMAISHQNSYIEHKNDYIKNDLHHTAPLYRRGSLHSFQTVRFQAWNPSSALFSISSTSAPITSSPSALIWRTSDIP